LISGLTAVITDLHACIVFTDEVERNCHFPASGWNCMTHRQALQGFANDASQALLHTHNKINLLAVPAGAGKWQLRSISERAVVCVFTE
jgi:hypothetical protein